MTAPTRPWVCATASSTGGSHRATGAPNQDAVATFETDDGVCVAVADGHGGARYVRSAIGSELAVDVARRGGRPDACNGAALLRASVPRQRRS